MNGMSRLTSAIATSRTMSSWGSRWSESRGHAKVMKMATGSSETRIAAASVSPRWITSRRSIIRHRLMDLRLVIHRGLTLAAAILVSLLPVAIFITFAWPRLSLHLEPHELIVLLVAIALVSLLIPFIRDLAGRFLDLKALLPFLTETVATPTRSEGVAIYLRDRRGFRRVARESRPVQGHFEAPAEAPTETVATLDRTRDLVLCEEVMRERPTEERRQLHEELTRLNWSLVLPLISENTVIGLIAVGPKLSGDPFYPQDLDLLMTLANQAGVAVKNAQLYAQVVLANEYINSIVATIESGVVAIDATGQIELFNRAAAQLTGLPAAETLDQPVTVLPACLSDALQGSVAAARVVTQPEVELSDGARTRPIICTTSPLLDAAGIVLGAVAVFSDLTPLKELETGRRRAERLSYFEMLASGIAHEIKNPLVAIKTFAQLLPRRHADAQFIAEFGRIATREILRMERLLERLHTLSRPSDRLRQPLDLRVPVTEAVETMRAAFEEKNLVVTVVTPPTPCMIRGANAELGQLFRSE